MASLAQVLDDDPTPLSPIELPLHLGQSPVNRRTLPRLSARFTVRPQLGGPEFRGIDLSFGGLMCVGSEPMWPGNPIDFDLILPGERTALSVRGRVVDLVGYRGEVAMRVRFDDLDLTSRKRIAAWMSRIHSV